MIGRKECIDETGRQGLDATIRGKQECARVDSWRPVVNDLNGCWKKIAVGGKEGFVCRGRTSCADYRRRDGVVMLCPRII